MHVHKIMHSNVCTPIYSTGHPLIGINKHEILGIVLLIVMSIIQGFLGTHHIISISHLHIALQLMIIDHFSVQSSLGPLCSLWCWPYSTRV